MVVCQEMLLLNLTRSAEILTKGYTEFGQVLFKDAAIIEADTNGKNMADEEFAFAMSGRNMKHSEIGL